MHPGIALYGHYPAPDMEHTCPLLPVLSLKSRVAAVRALPAGQPVLCDVTLADPAGERRTLPYPDKELTRLGIDEGSTVVLTADGTLKKA